jgi:hypothetical protein
MIYLCITCIVLSTRIVCFALFPLFDIPLHHLCFSVHPDGVCDAKVYHIEGTMQKTHNQVGQKNTSDAKIYHIEGTMQNTQSGWTEQHKWFKDISYRGNNAKHTIRCVFFIVSSIWYTFASLVFFCQPGLCVLHCSLYMIYLCITCVFLSTRIVCFALFPLYDKCKTHNPDGQKNTSDAKVYHIEGTMQNTQSGWTEKHKWCKSISYRGNNAKHTIRVDRKTHLMQRYII